MCSGDQHGHEIDVHSFTLDDSGNNVFGVEYERASLEGTGTVLGRAVRCVTPEWQVLYRSGYELRPVDYWDVEALCGRFGIPLPDGFLPPGAS